MALRRPPHRRLDAPEIVPEIHLTEDALAAEAGVPARVLMRKSSGDYRAADYLGGAFLALFVLLAMAVRPGRVDERRLPVVATLAFGLGALATAHIEGLRRPLAGARRRRANVELAARAAFVEARVPPGGVLIYLSSFEREAALVRAQPLDDALTAQMTRVREAMRVGTPKLVLGAVESLGTYLARPEEPS